MSVKKITIFQKNNTKITLTDKDCSLSDEQIKSQFSDFINSDKICIISTQEDILLIRPSEISSILINSQDANTYKKILDGNE